MYNKKLETENTRKYFQYLNSCLLFPPRHTHEIGNGLGNQTSVFQTAKKDYGLIHKFHFQDATNAGILTVVADTAHLETLLPESGEVTDCQGLAGCKLALHNIARVGLRTGRPAVILWPSSLGHTLRLLRRL